MKTKTKAQTQTQTKTNATQAQQTWLETWPKGSQCSAESGGQSGGGQAGPGPLWRRNESQAENTTTLWSGRVYVDCGATKPSANGFK